jgi:N6-adenosine-specific RNA methylase IME4
VADPPWKYGARMTGGLGYNRPAKGAPMKAAEMPYQTMTVEEICALPVASIAGADSHLYLWTTQTWLRGSYRVLDAWGYKQGAILVWAKPPKGVCGTYVCSTEFCIFGRRGTLQHKRRQIGTCYQWPRSAHSAKPDAFLDMVESVSPGPYLELFARRQRLGWDTWGNEALNHVELVPHIAGGQRP